MAARTLSRASGKAHKATKVHHGNEARKGVTRLSVTPCRDGNRRANSCLPVATSHVLVEATGFLEENGGRMAWNISQSNKVTCCSIRLFNLLTIKRVRTTCCRRGQKGVAEAVEHEMAPNLLTNITSARRCTCGTSMCAGMFSQECQGGQCPG